MNYKYAILLYVISFCESGISSEDVDEKNSELCLAETGADPAAILKFYSASTKKADDLVAKANDSVKCYFTCTLRQSAVIDKDGNILPSMYHDLTEAEKVEVDKCLELGSKYDKVCDKFFHLTMCVLEPKRI